MDGHGGMVMQTMMPMMMMMYMQHQGGNATFGGKSNATEMKDPFAAVHHRWFPVPKDVELTMIQKILHYTPWIEIVGIFALIGTIIGLVLRCMPMEEMPEEEEEAVEEKPVPVKDVRAILDAADEDDAAKLARIRGLIGEKSPALKDKNSESSELKDKNSGDTSSASASSAVATDKKKQ